MINVWKFFWNFLFLIRVRGRIIYILFIFWIRFLIFSVLIYYFVVIDYLVYEIEFIIGFFLKIIC